MAVTVRIKVTSFQMSLTEYPTNSHQTAILTKGLINTRGTYHSYLLTSGKMRPLSLRFSRMRNGLAYEICQK